jgi:hypothetical protein
VQGHTEIQDSQLVMYTCQPYQDYQDPLQRCVTGTVTF